MNPNRSPEHQGNSPVPRDRRHHSARRLLVLAGSLGVLVGTLQATYGAQIPDWTGNKAEPVALGLLTIAMSLLVIACAWAWRNPDQLLPPLTAAVPALVGFTTVGRLWYLPGPLAIAAAVIGVRHWRTAITRAAQTWPQLLLAGLGGSDLILAASAPPALAVLAAVSGAALIGAAVLGSHRPTWAAALLAAGTIPFAATAWTAVVPVLTLLLAATLTPAVTQIGRHPTRPAA